MKSLLIHPQIRTTDAPRHIPYGCGIIANVLESMGNPVAVLDLNALRLTLPAIKEELLSVKSEEYPKWDLIGVSALSSQYRYVKDIVRLARKEFPDATIVLGGGLLTAQPEDIMNLLPEVSLGVIGEGEQTIKEIADVIFSRRWSRVKGIVYRESGQLVRTSPRPPIENLDELPWPAYHRLEMEIYLANSPLMLSPEAMQARRRIDLLTEWGCPRLCTMCFHEGHSRMDLVRSYGEEKIKEMEKEMGKHIPMVRFRSPEKVVEHILWLRKIYACDFISCLDENILCDRKRFMKLCELMVDEDLHKVLRWGILGDVASVDEDMLRLFRDSGGAYCSYGGESCSDRLLKEIGKHTLKRQQQAAIDVSFKCQINPIMTYMCGFESETIDDILETVEFWLLNKMVCDPFYITPYPGTELYLKHRDRVLSQYGGDLDKFLCSLGDATELSANISPWKDWELIALKHLMFKRDIKRILAFAKDKGLPYSPEWEEKLPNLEAALESQRG